MPWHVISVTQTAHSTRCFTAAPSGSDYALRGSTYTVKPVLKLKPRNVPVSCSRVLPSSSPCQPSPVLVSPLTDKAVKELPGGSKYSSDLWVALATTGLRETDKSGSTGEPLSGFEKVMGTPVTGISCEDTVAVPSPHSSGQHLCCIFVLLWWGTEATWPGVKPASVQVTDRNLLMNLIGQGKCTQSTLCVALPQRF